MAVKFHVFANNQFVQTVEANHKTGTLRKFLNTLDGNSTPHYGFRRGGEQSPSLDGWYIMRSLTPIDDENVPPNVRMLHLLMSF